MNYTEKDFVIKETNDGLVVIGAGIYQPFNFITGEKISTEEQAVEVIRLLLERFNSQNDNSLPTYEELAENVSRAEGERQVNKELIGKLEKQLEDTQLAVAEIFETITGGNV